MKTREAWIALFALALLGVVCALVLFACGGSEAPAIPGNPACAAMNGSECVQQTCAPHPGGGCQ